MLFVFTVIVVVYVVLLTWVWKSLGNIEKAKKIVIIFFELLMVFVSTLITYNSSKNGIIYDNLIIEQKIRMAIVAIFMGVNGLAVLPFISSQISKYEENDISKEALLLRSGIAIIIYLFILIFECKYMKNTQIRNIKCL